MSLLNNYSNVSKSGRLGSEERRVPLGATSYELDSINPIIRESESKDNILLKYDEKFKGPWKSLTKVNFRKAPSTSDDIIWVIEKDEKVRCDGQYFESESDDILDSIWLKVRYNGEIGYVMKRYFRR